MFNCLKEIQWSPPWGCPSSLGLWQPCHVNQESCCFHLDNFCWDIIAFNYLSRPTLILVGGCGLLCSKVRHAQSWVFAGLWKWRLKHQVSKVFLFDPNNMCEIIFRFRWFYLRLQKYFMMHQFNLMGRIIFLELICSKVYFLLNRNQSSRILLQNKHELVVKLTLGLDRNYICGWVGDWRL